MPGTSLEIRLAEPVVFLCGSDRTVARRRNAAPPDTSPAMVRGILTLKLAKATKIRSISITLEGRAKTEWPEGIGAHRAEVTEDISILSASTVFFRAGHETDAAPSNSARRAMSLGPGVALDHEADDEAALSDDEDDDEDDAARHNQGTIRGRRISVDQQNFQRHFVEHNEYPSILTPPYTPRVGDQSSAPGSPRQTLQELRNALRADIATTQSPASSRPVSLHGLTSPQTAAPRAAASHTVVSAPQSQLPSTNVSSDASVRSFQPDISEHLSDEEDADHLNALRRPAASRRESSVSFLESPATILPQNDVLHSPPLTERQRSVSRSNVSHSPALRPGASTNRPSPSPAPPRPALQTSSPSLNTQHSSPGRSTFRPQCPESPAASSPARDRERSESRVRGRQGSRFSLSAVSSVLHEIGHEITEMTDRVRSKSRASVGPRSIGKIEAGGQNQIPEESGRDLAVERQHERERGGDAKDLKDEGTRGRPKERQKTALEKISASLGLDLEGGHGNEVHADSGMWQEFRKGTYNYPISFAIPSNTPPSLRCDFGSITYRLKAVVHRTGAFVPKLVAHSELTLISAPGEDDMEETENIIVERQWDEQLRYLINISGKSFPIGGVVPVQLVMMPLAKVRVYRITVMLEEKIDYYAHGRRVARHDPIRRYELMSLKHPHGSPKHHHEKGLRLPLLPILDEGDAQDSPVLELVERGNGDDDEQLVSLWNPSGPWTLQLQAPLPTCSSPVHFTCKHSKSNVTISHGIKIIVRVDRLVEDDKEKEKRKQFDIIIETPIHLLSCKCNPEYTALPPYSHSSPSQNQRSGAGPIPGACTCDHSKAERQNRVQTSATIHNAMSTLPVQGLGPGPFSVPAADFGAGLGRTSSGPNASAPDRMMSGFGADTRTPSRPGRAGVPVAVERERPQAGRLAESSERITALVDRSLQFARLVSGEESTSGETPPAYADAVNGTAEIREERGRERGRAAHVMFTPESRSGSQSRTHSRSRPSSRPSSRPASRPGSRPSSRPSSRPPSIMWP